MSTACGLFCKHFQRMGFRTKLGSLAYFIWSLHFRMVDWMVFASVVAQSNVTGLWIQNLQVGTQPELTQLIA